jgi:hypothetical protein
MRTLRPDEILAVEPGDLMLETGRHRQFVEHRIVGHPHGREWYRPEPELLDHIARMASIYAVPELPGPSSTWRGPAPEPLTEEEQAAVVLLLKYQDAEFDDLDDETLFALGAATFHSARILEVVIYHLIERGETFAGIGARLDAHEATVSRWAKPAKTDRRRRVSSRRSA